MILFPAIDLFEKKAVRLLKGDYAQMQVYSDNPAEVAEAFVQAGATHIHLVDLEGAREGTTPNLDVVAKIAGRGDLFCEIGGGIRSLETIERYLDAGVSRVILGTAAVNNRELLAEALARFGSRVAVGADVKDGRIAIKGWLEQSGVGLRDFLRDMQELGVANIICTDISRDGAMAGTNIELYRALTREFSVGITASGGVSSMDDVVALRDMGMYGAIVGKAYYTGAIDLAEAIAVAGAGTGAGTGAGAGAGAGATPGRML